MRPWTNNVTGEKGERASKQATEQVNKRAKKRQVNAGVNE